MTRSLEAAPGVGYPELAVHADRFVACFNYVDVMAGVPLHDDQGTYDRPHTLTAYFDPAKIDAILAQFGDKPWRGARPVVVPVLLVHGRKPPVYVLSAEISAGEEQRSSFAAAADQFGMDVRIPNDAELVAWGAGVGDFPSDPPPSSATQAIVAGTLDWSETLPGWMTGKAPYRFESVSLQQRVSKLSVPPFCSAWRFYLVSSISQAETARQRSRQFLVWIDFPGCAPLRAREMTKLPTRPVRQ